MPVKKIVIGFDGSTRSRKSLRRSIKEAQVWGAELTAVDAVPLASSAGILSWLPATVDRDSILRDVRDGLKQTCKEETADSGVKVHSHALDGNPAALLTEFSTAVDLVVVGTRGGGGFQELSGDRANATQMISLHLRCKPNFCVALFVATQNGTLFLLLISVRRGSGIWGAQSRRRAGD